MLLDPPEQQFDLPAALVEGGDVDGGALEIVGDEGEGGCVVTLELDPAQADGQFRIALAGESNLLVLENAEPIADGLGQGPGSMAIERPIWASLTLAWVMSRTRGRSAGGS